MNCYISMLKHLFGCAGFLITFQLLSLDKGGMEVSQQLMNMVSVLGLKETMQG